MTQNATINHFVLGPATNVVILRFGLINAPILYSLLATGLGWAAPPTVAPTLADVHPPCAQLLGVDSNRWPRRMALALTSTRANLCTHVLDHMKRAAADELAKAFARARDWRLSGVATRAARGGQFGQLLDAG